jgi:CPA2 family monovalent cation:H+ antiporter-2
MYNSYYFIVEGDIMLTIIVSTLFISLVINLILKKFNLPTIIGYIVTGTIIAYSFGLHDAVHNHELKEIAEFGVVFLMFTIGLEFSIEHLKKMRYEVFVAGTMQIVITSFVVYLMAYYIFDIEQKISFIISLVIALSSTAIVLKTFNDTGEINKRYGQRSLGILIMQDIAVIPILLIIGFMSNSGDESIGFVLLEMAISATVLVLILWLTSKYLLEPFFTQVVQSNSEELFIGTILFLAIGASYLAHALGFSYSLGAFIAGMLIAETKYKHQAEADLIPFRDILLGIFFITVGMQIDFDIVFEYIHIVLAIMLLAMALKFAIIYTIVKLKEDKRTSIKTALSLVQIGEFSLALLELARSNSLIGPPYGQILILVIVISMIMTPIILKNLPKITSLIYKNRINEHEDLSIISSEFQDHTIIIGFGEFGQSVAKYLHESSYNYLAIENNINTFHKIKDQNHPIIFGNALKSNILKHANLKEASSVVVAIDNPEKQYQVCKTLQKYMENNKIIVKVHSKKDISRFEEIGIQNLFVENEITSQNVAKRIIEE